MDLTKSKLNISRPSKKAQVKVKYAYSIRGGVYPAYILTLSRLAQEPNYSSTPLINNETVTVYPVCFQNYDTAVKPAK